MTLDNEAGSMAFGEPAFEAPAFGEDGRPDAPRTWTTPELVRLRAGATGNNTSTFVGDDGPAYIALS